MFIVHIVDSRRISGENGGDMRNKSTSSVGIPHKRTLNPPWKLQLVTQIINDGLKMKRIGFVKLFITEEDLSAKEILQRCEDQQKISQEKKTTSWENASEIFTIASST